MLLDQLLINVSTGTYSSHHNASLTKLWILKCVDGLQINTAEWESFNKLIPTMAKGSQLLCRKNVENTLAEKTCTKIDRHKPKGPVIYILQQNTWPQIENQPSGNRAATRTPESQSINSPVSEYDLSFELLAYCMFTLMEPKCVGHNLNWLIRLSW